MLKNEKLAQLKQILAQQEKQVSVIVPTSLLKSLSSLLKVDLTKEDYLNWKQANPEITDYLNNFYWEKDNNLVKGQFFEKNEVIYLSQDRINTKDLFVKTSSLLSPSNKIPKLFMVKVEELETMDKDISYDYWLIQAISALTKLKEKDLIQELPSFVKNHQKQLNKIKSFFHTSTPQLLGSGVDGLAFSIGNNFVLKIFTDEYSFNKAKEAEQRLHENPDLAKTEAMIYQVDTLGTFMGLPLYYYIMEKMNPIQELDLRKTIWEIINQVAKTVSQKDLLEIQSTITDTKLSKAKITNLVTSTINIINNTVPEQVEKVTNSLSLNKNWLSAFVEELIVKMITGRKDLHTGNIGVTQQGYLRYFDSAYKKDLDIPFIGGPAKAKTVEHEQETKVPGAQPIFDEATAPQKPARDEVTRASYKVVLKKLSAFERMIKC